jgi:pyrimidine-specific ribonucleoside hydrolase
MRQRRVWIDTDPALTAGNGEVDDAFALFQALRSSEFDVVGVSAIFGNCELAHAYPMAQEIVRQTGRTDIPVWCGEGVEGGCDSEAVAPLLEAINAGPITILALGPFTTIAAALARPGVALANIESIIFVGGRRPGQEFRVSAQQQKPFCDANFERDVGATAAVLALGLPLVFAGWEVCAQMWMMQEHLDWLSAHGDQGAQWLAASAQDWLANWQRHLGTPGFTPFDTLAVGWLLVPELFTSHHWQAAIDDSGPLAHLVCGADIQGAPITYLSTVDNDALRADLLARLVSPVFEKATP